MLSLFLTWCLAPLNLLCGSVFYGIYLYYITQSVKRNRGIEEIVKKIKIIVPRERRSPDRHYIFTTEYTEKHGKYNFRAIIRQIKVPEEGCKGEPGTVRVSPANK